MTKGTTDTCKSLSQTSRTMATTTVETSVNGGADYSAELLAIKERGFDMPQLASKLLQRFHGDVEKVVVRLQRISNKVEARRARAAARAAGADAQQTPNTVEAVTREEAVLGEGSSSVKTARVPPKFQAKVAEYESELKELKERGFDKPVMCIRMLMEFDGDVEKVADQLQHIKALRKARRARKGAQMVPTPLIVEETTAAMEVGEPAHSEEANETMDVEDVAPVATCTRAQMNDKAVEFEGELHELKSRGYDFPIASIRLLMKFNGDVEKVASKLERVKERRARKGAGKPARPIHAGEYAEQLEELRARGFDRPMQCLRVLHRCCGDVETAAAKLSALKERRACTGPRRRRGILMERKAARAGRVPPKYQAKADKYESELKELKERGFDKPALCIRMLMKFDGDVEKVAGKLCHIKARRACKVHAGPKRAARRGAAVHRRC